VIDIQRLRLQLPEGYEHRASRIVRLVGQALAREPVSHNGETAHLHIGPMALPEGATDRQAADRIARAIRTQLPKET